MREDLPEIILELKRRKFIITLASNGKKLVDKVYVKRLKIPVWINVQLQFDTLDDLQCELIRKERLTALKLQVIENLKEAGISVHLWVPLIKGINDNQIKAIVDFAARNTSVIKIVFLFRCGPEGRTAEHESLTAEEIIRVLQTECKLDEDAFMDYVRFDLYSSLFYQRLTNTPFLKYQTCTVSYYFFYLKNSLVPLSELIDIKQYNQFLESACRSLNGKKGFKKIYYLFRVSFLLC